MIASNRIKLCLACNIIDTFFEIRKLYDVNVFENFVVQENRFDIHLFDFLIINDDCNVHCFIIH